jgi:hypothetical protein
MDCRPFGCVATASDRLVPVETIVRLTCAVRTGTIAWNTKLAQWGLGNMQFLPSSGAARFPRTFKRLFTTLVATRPPRRTDIFIERSDVKRAQAPPVLWPPPPRTPRPVLVQSPQNSPDALVFPQQR